MTDNHATFSAVGNRRRNARVILLSSRVNRPIAPGRASSRFDRSWFMHLHPGLHQVLAGATQRPQRSGVVVVLAQRPPPMPVGAQRVREHVGVQPVVLIPGRAIPAAQGLDLPARDHEHRKLGPEKHLHHRAVAAFDGHVLHTGSSQPPHHLLQRAVVMGDVEPVNHRPVRHRPHTPRESATPSPPLLLLYLIARTRSDPARAKLAR